MQASIAADGSAHGRAQRKGRKQGQGTEMEDRRATVTDALQSTTFRLYSSAAAPVTGAAAPRHPCLGAKAQSAGLQLHGAADDQTAQKEHDGGQH